MCFVCFFLGQSLQVSAAPWFGSCRHCNAEAGFPQTSVLLQAFEQWKKLLDVLCRCSAAFVAAGDPSSPSVPRDLPQGIALKPQ